MVSVGEWRQKAAGRCSGADAGKGGRFCLYKKSQGFSKFERLKQKALFQRLFKQGRYFKGSSFSLRILSNGINITRLGISTNTKVFPKSTQRNRAKRLIREVFRRHKENLSKGYDILIKQKAQGPGSLKYKEVEPEILSLFKAAGILNKEWKQ